MRESRLAPVGIPAHQRFVIARKRITSFLRTILARLASFASAKRLLGKHKLYEPPATEVVFEPTQS